MAKQTYADVTVNASTGGEYKVGFFNIADGQEAIVRFLINSVDDFEIYTVHPITVGQSSYPNRRISCLRTNPKTDPMNYCPLCARGEKVQQRMYIKMIQYVNENGQITPKAVVWDRPAYSYAPQLKSYLDNYGPLTNIVCKIVRHGAGLDTKYDIIPNLNPQMFNEQIYPKTFSDFEGFNILGSMIMDRTFEDINQFVQTGQFPQKPTAQTAPATDSGSTGQFNPNAGVTADLYYSPQPMTQSNTAPAANPVMDRPVRYY